MKLLAPTALLASLLCSPLAMAEKIDCETLVELGSALDQIREGLNNGEDVDDETYAALADVTDTLRAVAEEEGNNKLDNALDRLETAHQNNDRAGYVSALETVDTVFGGFYNSECE